MTTERLPTPDPVPAVSDADAIDDVAWFDRNSNRRFRVRREGRHTVLVRRVKDAILLRTITGSTNGADTDIELAVAWYAAAYPHWSPEAVSKAALKAVKKGRAP